MDKSKSPMSEILYSDLILLQALSEYRKCCIVSPNQCEMTSLSFDIFRYILGWWNNVENEALRDSKTYMYVYFRNYLK